MSNTELTDFEYPDIARTDYIDESLDKIKARDDASKSGFRRIDTFPNVSASDIGMKVWLVGVGNFQLTSVDPVPQWKQLTDDSRDPAYTDWVRENFQPLSNLLSSLSRLSTASGAVPYFSGPNVLQATTLSQLGINLIASADSTAVRNLLGIGMAASLNVPIDGSYIKQGTISKDKIDADFARNLGWTTGDVKVTLKSTPDDGWIMMNDGSIGNTNSGATTRANADTYDLFMLLWNIPACGIQTSSGTDSTKTTAIQDWSANKRLLLPKTLGRALAEAGQGSGLTARALGSSVGEESYIEPLENACILKDGTIIQWGRSYGGRVTYQIPYTSVDSYKLSTAWMSSTKYTSGVQVVGKSATGFSYDSRDVEWIAIGK